MELFVFAKELLDFVLKVLGGVEPIGQLAEVLLVVVQQVLQPPEKQENTSNRNTKQLFQLLKKMLNKIFLIVLCRRLREINFRSRPKSRRLKNPAHHH